MHTRRRAALGRDRGSAAHPPCFPCLSFDLQRTEQSIQQPTAGARKGTRRPLTTCHLGHAFVLVELSRMIPVRGTPFSFFRRRPEKWNPHTPDPTIDCFGCFPCPAPVPPLPLPVCHAQMNPRLLKCSSMISDFPMSTQRFESCNADNWFSIEPRAAGDSTPCVLHTTKSLSRR